MAFSVVIALSLGLGTTLVLIPLALRFGRLAALQGRPTDWHHTHNTPVPRLGGAVLAACFVVVEVCIGMFHPELRSATPARDVVVIGSLCMFLLGFWDDIRPLRPATKLLGQIAIASAVCACGVGIDVCGTPFSKDCLHLGGWGPIVTVLWLVGLTNLINLIDGMDGLAGSICLMLMLLMVAVAHQNGNFELLASGMVGALVGFLCFNLPPARIYLGDGGAYFLGFQIGLYSVVNSHKGTVFAVLVAPLFVLALPVTDALVTLARRGLQGLPLFRPDRKHLHHRLMAAGVSRRKTVFWVYALNLVFLLMGLAVFWSRGESVPVLGGAAALVLFGCAGTCEFSRRWFALHRVVRCSLQLRREVQYARSLTRWLELEARRHPDQDTLWHDLVFAADKLGFASLQLTLQGEHRVWQRTDSLAAKAPRRYDCPNRSAGSLEFTAPDCPLGLSEQQRACLRHRQCTLHSRGCLADPRVFETVSDLLAEAWSRSVAQCNERRVQRDLKARNPNRQAARSVNRAAYPSVTGAS